MVRKVENKTKISNYETSWFNPRGQKGLICTRDNITMARRGQKGWICTRESIVVSERGGFVHVGWSAPHNCQLRCRHNWPIAGINVSHRPYATSAVRQPRRTWPAHGHGEFCKSLTIRYHFKRSVETQAFFGHVSTPYFIAHWKSAPQKKQAWPRRTPFPLAITIPTIRTV